MVPSADRTMSNTIKRWCWILPGVAGFWRFKIKKAPEIRGLLYF
jgi:hypothetical protein